MFNFPTKQECEAEVFQAARLDQKTGQKTNDNNKTTKYKTAKCNIYYIAVVKLFANTD